MDITKTFFNKIVPPSVVEPKPVDCKPVPIPEANGTPKLTPKAGCDPDTEIIKKKKTKISITLRNSFQHIFYKMTLQYENFISATLKNNGQSLQMYVGQA